MRNLYANVSTSFSFLFPSWNYDSTKEIELIKEKIIANHPDVKFSESIRRTCLLLRGEELLQNGNKILVQCCLGGSMIQTKLEKHSGAIA